MSGTIVNHNHDSKWTSEAFNNLYDLTKEKSINDEVVVNCNQMHGSNMNLKGPTVAAQKDVATKQNDRASTWQKVDGKWMQAPKKTPVEMSKHKAPLPPIPTGKHRSTSHEDLTEHSKQPYPSIFAIANLKMQLL